MLAKNVQRVLFQHFYIFFISYLSLICSNCSSTRYLHFNKSTIFNFCFTNFYVLKSMSYHRQKCFGQQLAELSICKCFARRFWICWYRTLCWFHNQKKLCCASMLIFSEFSSEMSEFLLFGGIRKNSILKHMCELSAFTVTHTRALHSTRNYKLLLRIHTPVYRHNDMCLVFEQTEHETRKKLCSTNNFSFNFGHCHIVLEFLRFLKVVSHLLYVFSLSRCANGHKTHL